VWLKVVITPLLGAIVFALLDIGWQLKRRGRMTLIRGNNKLLG